MSRCDACRVEHEGTGPLCEGCEAVRITLDALAESSLTHVLAHALFRSRRDAARRLGCTDTAHGSGVGNIMTRAGHSREALRRIATWGLRTGHYRKPAGFEDVSLPGENGSPSGEVKVTKVEPQPKAKKTSKPARSRDKYKVDKAAREAWKASHREDTEEEEPMAQTVDTLNLKGPAIEEIEQAKAHVERAEADYRAAFAMLAVPALVGAEMPDLELVRLAHEYGRAKGGFEVMVAMAQA